MPDPITIITTLHGLAEKLVNSIKGGQDAAKAQEILRLVGELQTEYFALQQHILKIETENAKLIRKTASPKSPNPKQQDEHAFSPEFITLAKQLEASIKKDADESREALRKMGFQFNAGVDPTDTGAVPDLDDVSIQILKTLAGAPKGAPKDRLVAQFGLSVGKGNLVFDRLSSHKLIEINSFVMGGGGSLVYHATRKCREYLDEKGLL